MNREWFTSFSREKIPLIFLRAAFHGNVQRQISAIKFRVEIQTALYREKGIERR